jgi:cytochrome P450
MNGLFSADMRRNPYPIYEALRAGGPVYHLAGPDLWLVLSYDGVKRALTDQEAFSSNVGPSRNVAFEWLLFMDPPRHTGLRAIITRAFTPRSIAALEPRIRAIATGLLDAALPRGEIDLVADLAVPLPMMVIAELLGLPAAEWPRLKRWADSIMDLALTIAGSDAEAAAASAAFLLADLEMNEHFTRLAHERRLVPRDDLLTRLVTAEVDGAGLSDGELVRFVQLLLAAGTETTTNLIDNAVLCLLEHPEAFALLRARPELLPSAIEETLRYRSPAQAVFRATRRDVELGGRTIPAGKMVLAVLGAANRDPAQFAEPARFDLARDPNPHIAFGHGIHFCLGAPLSRLEARVALGDLLARTRALAPATTDPWPPRRAFHVHGPTRLPLLVTPP